MKVDDSCIFCKIVGKQAPASIVFEDDDVMVFMDIRPLNEGHTLVIPKEHYVDVLDVPQDLLGYIYKIVKPISIAVKKAEKAGWYNPYSAERRGSWARGFSFTCPCNSPLYRTKTEAF